MAAPDPKRLAGASAALALLALGAAGCGGGGDGGGGEATPTAAERERYVAGVQDALEPIPSQSEGLVEEATQTQSPSELQTPLEATAQAYRDAASELESLAPPAAVTEEHEQLVDAHRDVAAAAAEAEQAAQEGDPDGLDRLREEAAEYGERVEELGAQFAEQGIEL